MDIFYRISVGMDGTPMIAHTDVSSRERWSLAYYVESLCKFPSCRDSAEPAGGALISARSAGALSEADPFANAWNTAPKFRVPLNALWNRGGKSPELTVSSLNDGKCIAFLLEWSDATKDTTTVLTESFADAIAMQFFAKSGFPPMAMGNEKAEVTLWHWRADWQEHVDQGRRTGVLDAHPWMTSDADLSPSLAALKAGNHIAFQQRLSPVEEGVARGYGSIALKPPAKQRVIGKGVWRQGHWRVVLLRRLSDDSGLSRSAYKNKVAFAIWNGSAGDRAGQKAISTWLPLILARN